MKQIQETFDIETPKMTEEQLLELLAQKPELVVSDDLADPTDAELEPVA